MIRLTLWALGEAEQAVEPAAKGWKREMRVFFSGGGVAGNHRRESITSDDDATRARSALRSDQALILL